MLNKEKPAFRIANLLVAQKYTVYRVNPRLKATEKKDDEKAPSALTNLDQIKEKVDVIDLVINPGDGLKIVKQVKLPIAMRASEKRFCRRKSSESKRFSFNLAPKARKFWNTASRTTSRRIRDASFVNCRRAAGPRAHCDALWCCVLDVRCFSWCFCGRAITHCDYECFRVVCALVLTDLRLANSN